MFAISDTQKYVSNSERILMCYSITYYILIASTFGPSSFDTYPLFSTPVASSKTMTDLPEFSEPLNYQFKKSCDLSTNVFTHSLTDKNDEQKIKTI